MWLCTQYGFFSVVCTKVETPNMILPSKQQVQIRARDRKHLELLRHRFSTLLAGAAIIETPNADYGYRIMVGRDTFLSLLEGLGRELDYVNFKDNVHRKLPWDHKYLKFLNYVWTAGMNMLQRTRQ